MYILYLSWLISDIVFQLMKRLKINWIEIFQKIKLNLCKIELYVYKITFSKKIENRFVIIYII